MHHSEKRLIVDPKAPVPKVPKREFLDIPDDEEILEPPVLSLIPEDVRLKMEEITRQLIVSRPTAQALVQGMLENVTFRKYPPHVQLELFEKVQKRLEPVLFTQDKQKVQDARERLYDILIHTTKEEEPVLAEETEKWKQESDMVAMRVNYGFENTLKPVKGNLYFQTNAFLTDVHELLQKRYMNVDRKQTIRLLDAFAAEHPAASEGVEILRREMRQEEEIYQAARQLFKDQLTQPVPKIGSREHSYRQLLAEVCNDHPLSAERAFARLREEAGDKQALIREIEMGMTG